MRFVFSVAAQIATFSTAHCMIRQRKDTGMIIHTFTDYESSSDFHNDYKLKDDCKFCVPLVAILFLA